MGEKVRAEGLAGRVQYQKMGDVAGWPRIHTQKTSEVTSNFSAHEVV
jgi:hypothetical protein